MNTNRKGDVSEAIAIACLTTAGFSCSIPLSGSSKYDLIADKGGVLSKVQVKTLRRSPGTLSFRPMSIDRRGEKVRYLSRDVDAFVAVDITSGDCYWIPFRDDLPFDVILRTEPSKNGQVSRVTWAKDYLIKRVDMAQ